MRLSRSGPVEGFAETDDPCIGVNADPEDVGVFLCSQRLESCDLHGLARFDRVRQQLAVASNGASRHGQVTLRARLIFHNMFSWGSSLKPGRCGPNIARGRLGR